RDRITVPQHDALHRHDAAAKQEEVMVASHERGGGRACDAVRSDGDRGTKPEPTVAIDTDQALARRDAQERLPLDLRDGDTGGSKRLGTILPLPHAPQGPAIRSRERHESPAGA